MDTYYKSVGRNSTLLLNFPITLDGRIHPTDSLRGIAFAEMIKQVFDENLATKAKVEASNVRGGKKKFEAKNVLDDKKYSYWATDDSVTNAVLTLDFQEPTTFNRFLVEEYIPLGQRVKKFKLEAFVNNQWTGLTDALVDNGDGLSTIGNRRIICFPDIEATQLRFTIIESKASPLISKIGVYYAPEITDQIPNSGEKNYTDYYVFFANNQTILIDIGGEKIINGFRYLPPQESSEGVITHYTLSVTSDWSKWTEVATGEFSNVKNNPIWQHLKFEPLKGKVLRLEAKEIAEGERASFADLKVLTEEL